MTANAAGMCIAIALVAVATPSTAARRAPEFLTQWGRHGTADGQFYYPHGIAVDASGHVYVADRCNFRIQKFSSSGVFLGKWGSAGSSIGKFYAPLGVEVDASGNVYVSEGSRLQKFDPEGHFISVIGAASTAAAVGASGEVFIASQSGGSVQRFTGDGDYISQWGAGGGPAGIATDAKGNVYVSSTSGHKVQKFTRDGTLITEWGGVGNGDGQFLYPQGIAVDPRGIVYVVDMSNSRIQEFTEDGRFLGAWGTYGSGPGQFDAPWDVAVDRRGRIYVIDGNNGRVQVFGRDSRDSSAELEVVAGTDVPTSVRLRGRTLEYSLAVGGEVEVSMFDIAGRHLATVDEGWRAAGAHQLRWDAGRLGSGVYFVRLRAAGETVTSKALVLGE